MDKTGKTVAIMNNIVVLMKRINYLHQLTFAALKTNR